MFTKYQKITLVSPSLIGPDDQPDVRPVDADNYLLFSNYEVQFIDRNGEYVRMVIPFGEKTDLASIPKLLWTILDLRPDGIHRAAAVAHDYLCRHNGTILNHSATERTIMVIPSNDAHRLFREMLKAAGVRKTRAWAMFLGVWAFGPRWISPNE